MKDKNLLYIHSKCCGEHMDLVYDKTLGDYTLACCKCGEPVGLKDFIIIGPDLKEEECEVCKDAHSEA